MMKKIMLCVMILCLISPVLGYTTLLDETISTPGSTPGATTGTSKCFEFSVKDYTSFAGNVTYVKMDLFGYKADNLTGNYYNMPVSHPTQPLLGYADVLWSWTPAATYSGKGTVELKFYNMTKPDGFIGEKGLRIGYVDATKGGIPISNWRPLVQASVSNSWGSLNWSPYMVRLPGTNLYNGTYKIYSGVEDVEEGEYGNLTINVKSATTAVNIENAYIEYQYHPIAGAFGRTDINGNITFIGIEQNITPHTLSAYASGYGYYEELYAFKQNNAFKQIYLTPTSLPNTTNFIKVNMRDSSNNLVLDDLHLFVYDFNTSEWYERYSMNGVEYITLVGTAGNKPLIYGDSYTFVATKNGYISANETITYEYGGQVVDLYLNYVTHEGELEIWTDVVDAENGYTIGGATISLWDNYHKEWKNKTAATGAIAISASGTNGEYPITVGTNYTLCGSANGYSDYCTDPFRFKLENDKVPFILPLSLLGVAPSGNFTTTIKIIDYDTRYPIAGAAITLSNGQGVTTNTQGVAKLISPAGSYTISAYKDGYAGSTQTLTGADGQSVAVNFELMKGTSYPTLTPTPSPTLTYIGGQPIGEPAVCGISDGTIFGYMLAYIACWGADDRYTQNLILASLVIIVFMFFGARYGKGLGAAIGAAAGFVISVAMNLIPLWVFFAMVIITGLIFGLRLYTANK
jgi:hypothetical protein